MELTQLSRIIELEVASLDGWLPNSAQCPRNIYKLEKDSEVTAIYLMVMEVFDS